MVTNKYASRELYQIVGLRSPVTSLDELYNLYGVTSYRTDSENHNVWYSLEASSWLTQVSYDTLYDSHTNKYFIKGHFTTSDCNSSWLTIYNQASGAYKDSSTFWEKLSPSNTVPSRPMYRLYDGITVDVVEFTTPSNEIVYYIHPNYMSAANLGWYNEQELLALGYSFTPPALNFIYNLGSNSTSHTSIGLAQY